MHRSSTERVVADLTRLHEQATALADRVAAARVATAGDFRGADPSGTVRLTVDATGRTVDVVIAADWRRAVGPDGLGGAVRAAWDDAAQHRLIAWSAALTTERATRTGPVRSRSAESGLVPRAAPVTGRPGDLLSGSTLSNLSGVTSLLDDAEKALDRLEQAGPGATVSGHHSGRHLAIWVSAGAPVELRADRTWLADVSARDLAAAIFEALRDAATRAEAVEADRRPSALAELQQFTADPVAMLRTLGLLRD